MIAPTLAFIAWVPASLFFFWRRSPRTAILVNFLAGWALLPGASYAPSNAIFPYWILGSSLPAGYFFTKASVTGATCLLGILLFDSRALLRFRLSQWDTPMLAWCVVPLLSALANYGVSLAGLRGAAYLTLSWGVPYLAGRLYFAERQSLLLAAEAFVAAGLAYVPVCMVEIFTGPQVYALLYGYEPYRWIGAQRYFGYRPIGLMEDGNQLGIWMATSALIAAGLWRRRLVERVLGIPIAWAACALLAMTLLCQSGGSILLLLCLLPLALLDLRRLPRAVAAVFVCAVLCFMALRLANVVSLRGAVEHNRFARAAAEALKGIGRGSLGWRLSQDEQFVSVALQAPVLGSGVWDWWRAGGSRPWGLWLLAFGMYGILGLLALECLQFAPVARSIWSPTGRPGLASGQLGRVLAAAIVMSAVDSLLNSAVVLPVVLLIGAMSAPEPSRVSGGGKRSQASGLHRGRYG